MRLSDIEKASARKEGAECINEKKQIYYCGINEFGKYLFAVKRPDLDVDLFVIMDPDLLDYYPDLCVHTRKLEDDLFTKDKRRKIQQIFTAKRKRREEILQNKAQGNISDVEDAIKRIKNQPSGSGS